jgi:hypothetical protein
VSFCLHAGFKMKRIFTVCTVALVALLAGGARLTSADDEEESGARVIAMAVNANGSCQIPSPKITLCQNVSPGVYRIEFARFAFSKIPLLVIMPLQGNQTVNGISQGQCPPNICVSSASGWFAQYSFSSGQNAIHNFIAATGY